MLLSMTGFGSARLETPDCVLAVEIRSVNNRFFKLSWRAPEALGSYEPEIEKLIRETITRGAVNLNLRLERKRTERGSGSIDAEAFGDGYRQLLAMSHQFGLAEPTVADVLLVPGVVREGEWTTDDAERIWPAVQQVVREAVAKMCEFRTAEGAGIADELRLQQRVILDGLAVITESAPQVVEDYRQRLMQRVRDAFQAAGADVTAADVLREVSLFADRVDVNEEITRLRTHLQQFSVFLEQKEPPGRKLDFLTQEMFREVNTIGSKANHAGIAHRVVELKAALERIREVVQNIE